MSLIYRSSSHRVGHRTKGIDRRVEVTRAIRKIVAGWEAAVRAQEPRARTRGLTYAINCGWCADLADELERRFPEGLQLATDHAAVNPKWAPYRLQPAEVALMEEAGHVWFYLQGLHFDAEAPHGVRDWRDLPFFRRWLRPAKTAQGRAAVVQASRVDRHELEERLEARPEQAERLLLRLGADRLRLTAPTWVLHQGKRGSLVIERNGSSFYVQDAKQWIYDTDVDSIFPTAEEDFNRDFWERPAPLYHATTRENAARILREGLARRNATRGIANRGTGPAVFTTLDREEAEDGAYGDVVFTIDTRAMKRAGFMPFVAEEEPIRKYSARQALASMLSMDDAHFDLEGGISFNTIVIFGHVPPQYLSV